MAYQTTFYITNVPVTCTEDGDHDWINADFMIDATANASNTAYVVKVYARINAGGRMNWSGDGDIRVTCNGIKKSAHVELEMYGTGTTIWDGPATFEFGAPGEVQLNMNFDLDLTRTEGFQGGDGPNHNSDGGNLQHFYYNNYTIKIGEDGGLPPLITPPIISGLTNTNKYNSNSAISASTNSIGISWSESGTVTNRYYRLNGGSWVSVNSASATITGLSEGTDYNIEVKCSNSSGDSNIINTLIRTRYNAPVVSLTYVSSTLDSMVFKWTSNKSLNSSQYKIGNGSWVNSGNGMSGTITINQLTPNTSYTVYFKGVSAALYDGISSNEASASGTTLDMARITSIGDCIFGNSISINISKVVTNVTKLKVWSTGNSNSFEFEFNVTNGTNTFTPTQDQLDKMYKCFSTSNSIPIYFTLTTTGQWSNWSDTQQNKTLQLTGIAKTAHVGITDTPRRAQVFIGVDGVPRRAIMWVGVDNKPRRCI